MKSLREYRILLRPNDGVSVSFSSLGSSKESSELEIYDISSSGVGLFSTLPFEPSELLNIVISYHDITLKGVVKVAHCQVHYERTDRFFVGLEFQDQDLVSSEELIFHIIENMSKKRMKTLMFDILQNEGLVINDEDQLKLSSTIVLDLFSLFSRYTNSFDLMYLFAQEVRRKIGAKTFRFYRYDEDYKNVFEKQFVDSNTELAYYPIIGAIKEVYETGKVVYSRISKKNDESFYNMFKAVNSEVVHTYLLAPVYDKNGVKVGIIEYTNKENNELFNTHDVGEVKLLAFVLGLTFSIDYNYDIDNYVKKLAAFYNDGVLIGPSEQNRYLNSTIMQAAQSDENLFITGEYGTGKKLIGIIVHEKSKRNSHLIGHLNCHSIQDNEDISSIFKSDKRHSGYLEMYNGGTIVIKDINFLSYKQQKQLHEILLEGHDIRVIATSTESYEVLSHQPHFFIDLLELLAGKVIRVPSLRERPEDITPLIHFFTYSICMDSNFSPKLISNEVINKFHNYDWPGNISELKIAISRLIALQRDSNVIKYRQIRTIPILDRELSSNVADSLGITMEISLNGLDLSYEEFEDLYFYFFVEHLIKNKNLEIFEISHYLDIPIDQIKEKLFIVGKKVEETFGVHSNLIDYFLEKQAA